MAKTLEMARFDVRLPKEKKEFLESAMSLGGFGSFSEFILSAADDKAKLIFLERKNWLATKADQDAFFNAIISPPEPNERLKAAAARYKEATK